MKKQFHQFGRKLSLVFLFVFPVTSFAINLNVTVHGMVCGFCAQGITKKFQKESAIQNVDVRLSEKRVTLGLKNGHDISDQQVIEILKDSGFNVTKIERN